MREKTTLNAMTLNVFLSKMPDASNLLSSNDTLIAPVRGHEIVLTSEDEEPRSSVGFVCRLGGGVICRDGIVQHQGPSYRETSMPTLGFGRGKYEV